jgi:hypothetical protein
MPLGPAHATQQLTVVEKIAAGKTKRAPLCSSALCRLPGLRMSATPGHPRSSGAYDRLCRSDQSMTMLVMRVRNMRVRMPELTVPVEMRVGLAWRVLRAMLVSMVLVVNMRMCVSL